MPKYNTLNFIKIDRYLFMFQQHYQMQSLLLLRTINTTYSPMTTAYQQHHHTLKSSKHSQAQHQNLTRQNHQNTQNSDQQKYKSQNSYKSELDNHQDQSHNQINSSNDHHQQNKKQTSSDHQNQSHVLPKKQQQLDHKNTILQINNTNHSPEQPLHTTNKGSKTLSSNRLAHLQEVFRHYCTHLFRVGKHMTFERLEYEKIHMTIDRFFVFLKDFQLTVQIFGETKRMKQIVPKATIITIFKKVSSNSKDITFEQFILCLQKLAEVYYDNYKNMKEQPSQKQSHIAPGLKRIPKRRMIFQQQEAQTNQKQQQNRKKDQYQRINNKIEQISDKEANIGENQSSTDYIGQLNNMTKQQKIEKFYQKIGIDSIKDYKTKIGLLNLPVFRPIAKSLQSKTVQTRTQQRQPQTQKVQDDTQKFKIQRKIPNKIDLQVLRNKRSQSLAHNRSKTKLERYKKQKINDKSSEHGIQPQLDDQIDLRNTLEPKKKKRTNFNLKVTQEVSRAMFQKLGIREYDSTLLSNEVDEDARFLAQYKMDKYSQEQIIKSPASQRLLRKASHQKKDKNENKLILVRQKSKSSTPAQNSNNSPIAPTNKIERIVNQTKKRAQQVKKQQKINQNNKNELIKRIGKTKFLSQNR